MTYYNTFISCEDKPSNLVLLCRHYHLDNLNVADKEIMWDWLRTHKVPFYDTFWNLQGLEEYKKIYSKTIEEELRERNIVVCILLTCYLWYLWYNLKAR